MNINMNALLIILGVILGIAGLCVSFVSEKHKKIYGFITVAGCLLVVLGGSFKIIPTGYTGVRTTFGQVDEKAMSTGFNWKLPFVQRISLVNNKLQNMVVVSDQEIIESTIKGKIPIKISDVTVSYYINPEKAVHIYSTVSDADNLLTFNIVSSAIKAATPEFDTDNVVVRSNVEPAILLKLQDYVNNKYGENVLNIAQITIGNISFTEDYNKSIEEKNNAAQAAQTQEIINKQNINTAKADAEVVKTKAEAEAQAKIIKAEADATANNLISSSINENILKEKYIDKWDGKLPKVSSDNNEMLINADDLLGNGE